MPELSQVEIAPDLPVDPPKQVEIELCRNPGRIVICRVQHRRVFAEVGPENHGVAFGQRHAASTQKSAGFLRLEVADCRAWKKEYTVRMSAPLGNDETFAVVGTDCYDAEVSPLFRDPL